MQRDAPVRPDETPVTAALRRMASIMGWCVTSTTDGAHSKMSYHHSGRAVDLAARSGPGIDTSALLEINEQIIRLIPLSMIVELIYSGPGNICVKGGRVVRGDAAYGPTIMGRHHDHVHLAVVSHFTYQGGPEMPADDPKRINVTAPVVGMAASPTGRGYWLVCADGGVFAFGDAEMIGNVEYVKPDDRAWLPKA